MFENSACTILKIRSKGVLIISKIVCSFAKENRGLVMENNKTYSYEEAFAAALDYFAGDELAARVWVNSTP